MKASKLHLIVKEKNQDKAKQIFQGRKITITTEGQWHLGLAIIRNCIDKATGFEKIIKEKFILSFVCWFSNIEKLRQLLADPCKLGGMGRIGPTENANDKYNNSIELTS